MHAIIHIATRVANSVLGGLKQTGGVQHKEVGGY